LSATSSKLARPEETSKLLTSCSDPASFCMYCFPAPPEVQGINNVVTACRAAFEHFNVTGEDIIAKGYRAAARFTACIHRGEFMGLFPTNKSIAMTGIEIFRIEEGKITELWGEANHFWLMQQLSILPSMAGQR